MANPISSRVVAKEVHFDDGGVGIQIGDMVYLGMDLADLIYAVENRDVIDKVFERPPVPEIEVEVDFYHRH